MRMTFGQLIRKPTFSRDASMRVFGGGGGYYAHSYYGAPGLGGVLGIVLIVVLVLWFMGR